MWTTVKKITTTNVCIIEQLLYEYSRDNEYFAVNSQHTHPRDNLEISKPTN